MTAALLDFRLNTPRNIFDFKFIYFFLLQEILILNKFEGFELNIIIASF